MPRGPEGAPTRKKAAARADFPPKSEKFSFEDAKDLVVARFKHRGVLEKVRTAYKEAHLAAEAASKLSFKVPKPGEENTNPYGVGAFQKNPLVEEALRLKELVTIAEKMAKGQLPHERYVRSAEGEKEKATVGTVVKNAAVGKNYYPEVKMKRADYERLIQEVEDHAVFRQDLSVLPSNTFLDSYPRFGEKLPRTKAEKDRIELHTEVEQARLKEYRKMYPKIGRPLTKEEKDDLKKAKSVEDAKKPPEVRYIGALGHTRAPEKEQREEPQKPSSKKKAEKAEPVVPEKGNANGFDGLGSLPTGRVGRESPNIDMEAEERALEARAAARANSPMNSKLLDPEALEDRPFPMDAEGKWKNDLRRGNQETDLRRAVEQAPERAEGAELWTPTVAEVMEHFAEIEHEYVVLSGTRGMSAIEIQTRAAELQQEENVTLRAYFGALCEERPGHKTRDQYFDQVQGKAYRLMHVREHSIHEAAKHQLRQFKTQKEQKRREQSSTFWRRFRGIGLSAFAALAAATGVYEAKKHPEWFQVEGAQAHSPHRLPQDPNLPHDTPSNSMPFEQPADEAPVLDPVTGKPMEFARRVNISDAARAVTDAERELAAQAPSVEPPPPSTP